MKPRFVAGAVCPQCRAIDRIVLEAGVNQMQRRCVACGFSEVIDASEQPGLIKGRLERPRREGVTAQPIKILERKTDDEG